MFTLTLLHCALRLPAAVYVVQNKQYGTLHRGSYRSSRPFQAQYEPSGFETWMLEKQFYDLLDGPYLGF